MSTFVEYIQESAANTALQKKAEASGVSLEILKKVYRRGVAAWNSGHRPGTTPQQWGMARVNSYITKGKGTYYGADKDLREEMLVFDLEEAIDAIDQGEYDYEGAMTRTQLQTILRSASELIDMLKNDDNMPEWVQSKITKAEDYMSSVRDYLMSREDLDESESWEAGYKRRVVKTTKPEHKEDGYDWRIKGKERPEISIKLYKEKPSQSEFNKQMRRVAGHEFGEEYTVEDSRAKNKAYHKGVSDSTARARVAHWKKMDKLSDRDPRSYEPAPGDATAKTKESVHTKKYREMYGEESMLTFYEYLEEASHQDLATHVINNTKTGRMVSRHSSLKDAKNALAARIKTSKGDHYKIVRVKKEDLPENFMQGVAEGSIIKSIRRRLQGWGTDDAPTPKELVRQNKAHSDDTIKALARDTRKINPHTPGGLQKRVVDREMKRRGLGEEVKGWKHAGRDLMKSRQEKSDAAKEVRLVSLKKDGTESKMHDAEKRFNSEDEARQHHERVKKLNPNRAIAHNMYVGDKVEKLS